MRHQERFDGVQFFGGDGEKLKIVGDDGRTRAVTATGLLAGSRAQQLAMAGLASAHLRVLGKGLKLCVIVLTA